MAIHPLPIFTYFDKQRFTQFGSMDCANWYGVQVESGKKKQAQYPTMGRRHINVLNQNRLIFDLEPRAIFKTINYFYVIDGTRVYQVDSTLNRKQIGSVALGGNLWFAFLSVGPLTYAMLTDEQNIYVITESGAAVTMGVVTDPLAPGGSTTGGKPLYVAAFGNRFVVSVKGTPDFYLTTTNLTGTLNTYFNVNGTALFARASGVIGQFAVLHNQLYILCDYTTDVWANIITQISVGGVTREFPWKLNSSYNWDYGIEDPFSLSVDFGRMCWLARNATGLVSFMASDGQQPENISSQAVNVLLEGSSSDNNFSPFLANDTIGFLYQYENTIFYRASAGPYHNFGQLDVSSESACLEYNFGTKTWHRCIELNGERNRIQRHIYFGARHLVTVQDDPAIYQMAGDIYSNELRNTTQPNQQADDAFSKFPMRYEAVTQQIYQEDYSEFKTDYVEIDFVFGEQSFYKSNAPFLNTVYVVTEDSTPESPIFVVDEDGKFLIQEGTNTPTFDDTHYNALFKPSIELYYSDDGGVTFLSADVRPFAQLGQYRWRMRWYQLGVSRNRCYKLICVSSAPIIILGGIHSIDRTSGGAN